MDVMSCVPYEQHTFEYGPRDYLNQLTTLISTLRGGQQRYLPLLLSKINETVPSMTMPAYATPALSGSAGFDGLYDGSQSQSSAPNSEGSTPFQSPSLSSACPQSFGFPDMSMDGSPTSAGFPAGVASGGQYADLTVTAHLHLYQDPVMQGCSGAAGSAKFEMG